jgi:hypothetical protein
MIPLLAQGTQDTSNPLRFDAAVSRWRIDGNCAELLPVLAAGLSAADSATRELAFTKVTQISGSCRDLVQLLVKSLGDPEMKI